jgi:hypothetical protein
VVETAEETQEGLNEWAAKLKADMRRAVGLARALEGLVDGVDDALGALSMTLLCDDDKGCRVSLWNSDTDEDLVASSITALVREHLDTFHGRIPEVEMLALLERDLEAAMGLVRDMKGRG